MFIGPFSNIVSKYKFHTDSRCSKIELKPEGSMPLIALASYPRSGNTWTRQLIERGTGLLTGSVYWEHERLMTISNKSKTENKDS